MAKHEVEVTISADGEVEFHVEGMAGKGCLTILKDLERALGKAKAAPVPTADMHATVGGSTVDIKK